MVEIWQPIAIHGLDKWDISTRGNCRRNCGGPNTFNGRCRKKLVRRDTLGRPFATLSFGDKSKGRRNTRTSYRTTVYKVSVLVLTTFVGPRPSRGHMASHLNDKPLEDHLTNLAWETQSQNERRKKINRLLQEAYAQRKQRGKNNKACAKSE